MGAGASKGARGRPPTPPAGAAARQARWDHAASFAGLSHEGIAEVVGRSVSRVRHYCASGPEAPPEDVVVRLEAYVRERVEREAERLRAA